MGLAENTVIAFSSDNGPEDFDIGNAVHSALSFDLVWGYAGIMSFGQAVFFGKGRCAECHPAPYYTDNLMHNLKTERFFRPQMVNGRMASADGPIKPFPVRGIKDSPTYLHDGRLLTLEDTVEFFNLVLELKLTEPEKKDLVAFMRQL